MTKYEYKYCSSDQLYDLITRKRKIDKINIEQFLNEADINYHVYRRIKSNKSISNTNFIKIAQYLDMNPKMIKSIQRSK